MTKKLTALLLTLCMAVFLACPVFAVQSGTVYDDADLLTQEQADTLAGLASTLSDKYQCDVAIQTVKALPTGDIAADAETCFKDAQLGRGDDKSGILLYYADTSGEYYIYTSGYGSEILTNFNYNDLCESYITPAFKDGAYAAFTAYLTHLESYFDGTSATGGADAASGTDVSTAGDYVLDNQKLLTADEATALNSRCAELAAKYGCGVYFYTTDSADGDADNAALNVAETTLGLGSDSSSNYIVFYQSTGDRKYRVVTNGTGKDILPDAARDRMLKKYVVPKLKTDDYNAAYNAFLDQIAANMATVQSGGKIDTMSGGVKAAIVFGIPLLIALIVCLIFKAQMKTAVEATEADDYLLRDQFHVTSRADEFLYQTVTVVHHESSSDSSDSGPSVGGGSY